MKRNKKQRLFLASGTSVSPVANVITISPDQGRVTSPSSSSSAAVPKAESAVTPTPSSNSVNNQTPATQAGAQQTAADQSSATPSTSTKGGASIVNALSSLVTGSGSAAKLSKIGLQDELAEKFDPESGSDPEPAGKPETVPAEEPQPELAPEAPKQWTLLGVTMKPLFWVLAGTGTVLLTAMAVKYLCKE